MSDNLTSCHGTFQCLRTGSRQWVPSRLFHVYQKLSSFVTWHRENTGLRALPGSLLTRLTGRGVGHMAGPRTSAGQTKKDAMREVLALEPGDLVVVKPVEEILATLDVNRKCKGLLWMTGMSKYCGKQCRVHKRVGRIVLEANGELRSMKNTVLLEGAMCDGTAFGGCDRSCFHFWREVWLERVDAEENE